MKKSRIEKDSWLLTRPIAHRGLYDDHSPENSRAAYEKAIEKNIPIEMDVQLTKDLIPVCFHDDNISRMTGVDSLIWDMTYEELSKVRLSGTDEKIMTFAEFLTFVNGRTPVLIEVKSQRVKKTIADKMIPLLENYRGEFAVQSFDPLIMAEFAKKKPEWTRGQLVDKDRHKGRIPLLIDFMLWHAMFNVIVHPDFINMNLRYLPVKRMRKKRPMLCWTVRSEEDLEIAREHADNFIYEKIRI